MAAKKATAKKATAKKKEMVKLIKHIHLDLIDDILGTLPGDSEIYETYIGKNAPDAMTLQEELENITTEEAVEKGMTMFPKNKDGKPIMYTYQIKGFMKSAARTMAKYKDSVTKTTTSQHIVEIDKHIFVWPDATKKAGREIVIHTDQPIATCQRPLRANGPQGERVALACSECIRAGAFMEFDIEMFDKDDWPMVKEWLDYGVYNGLGQWRNSGKGAFTWHEMATAGTTIFK